MDEILGELYWPVVRLSAGYCGSPQATAGHILNSTRRTMLAMLTRLEKMPCETILVKGREVVQHIRYGELTSTKSDSGGFQLTEGASSRSHPLKGFDTFCGLLHPYFHDEA